MKNQGERGFVLLTVMILVIVAGMIASLAQGRSLTLAKDSVRQKGEAQALYAAEGGLAKARHALRSDRDWKGAQLQVGAFAQPVEVGLVEGGLRRGVVDLRLAFLRHGNDRSIPHRPLARSSDQFRRRRARQGQDRSRPGPWAGTPNRLTGMGAF